MTYQADLFTRENNISVYEPYSETPERFIETIKLFTRFPHSECTIHYHMTVFSDSEWLGKLSEYGDTFTQELYLELLHVLPKFKPGCFRVNLLQNRLRLSIYCNQKNNVISYVNHKFDLVLLNIDKNFDITEKILRSASLLSHKATRMIVADTSWTEELDWQNEFQLILRKHGYILSMRSKSSRTYSLQFAQSNFKHWWSISDTVIPKTALVIGAGIAGATIAHRLAQEGIKVTVLEKNHKAAQEGSGNEIGMVTPYFQAQHNPTSAFYVSAYAHAVHLISRNPACIHSSGSSKYLTKAKEKQHGKGQAIHQISESELTITPPASVDNNDYASPATAEYKNALNISPVTLISDLLKPLQVIYQAKATKLTYHKGTWNVSCSDGKKYSSDCLVLANATELNALLGSDLYPIGHRHGQTSTFSLCSDKLNKRDCLKSSLHFGSGYCISSEDRILIGAHHNKNLDFVEKPPVTTLSHRENKRMFLEEFPEYNSMLGNVISGHSAIRAMSPDRLPLVGPVTLNKEHDMRGLYTLTGLGARGLSIASYCAEILSDIITRKAVPLDIDTFRAIHPMRYIERLKSGKKSMNK